MVADMGIDECDEEHEVSTRGKLWRLANEE